MYSFVMSYFAYFLDSSMLCVAVVCSFFIAGRVIPCKYAMIYLSSLLFVNIWVLSNLGL